MFALTRILVPTNLGEPSRTAIKYGVAFARQFRAKLFLVHVLPARELEAALETERVLEVFSPNVAAAGAAVAVAGEPDPGDIARNAAREDLARLLSADDEQATRAEYLLRPSGVTGPGDAIIRCAKEIDVELIVMGKHRLGFVEHLVAGSVAEKVIRHAPCPVLVVQHPEHDFVVSDASKESMP
ncbi:MAG TPA: universal stress protein [Gammaproteobacteria bacterium]|nr:universal stress protein [Gammaproteobacteria bacterium]